MAAPPEVGLLAQVLRDDRYRRNIRWGAPRPGHSEGSLRAHIAELEKNLGRLAPRLGPVEVARLRLLVHTHDLFKPQAREGVAILDPASHASLAAAYLEGLGAAPCVVAVAQHHDRPYSIRLATRANPDVAQERIETLHANIPDWDLFVAFVLVDDATASKCGETSRWFLEQIADSFPSRFGPDDRRLVAGGHAG
jgi:hypothetical protein